MSNVEKFKGMVESIPVLSDDKVKLGEFSHIDSNSVIHFFIYPFLNTLGYNVFNPEELKLNYEKEGYKADVVIFEEGEPLAVFKLIDLEDEIDNSEFTEDEIYGLRKLGAQLVVLTNGLNYKLYSFIDGVREEFLRFSLAELDNKIAEKVYNVLHVDHLSRILDNNEFFTEKIIEDKYGELSDTTYLMGFVEKELKNPSASFIEMLSGLMARRYVKYTITEKKAKEIAKELEKELEGKPEVLFNNITGGKGLVEEVCEKGTFDSSEKEVKEDVEEGYEKEDKEEVAEAEKEEVEDEDVPKLGIVDYGKITVGSNEKETKDTDKELGIDDYGKIAGVVEEREDNEYNEEEKNTEEQKDEASNEDNGLGQDLSSLLNM